MYAKMVNEIILQIYLYMYRIYIYLYKLIMNIFGPIHIIYYFDGQRKKNITLSRYLVSNDNPNSIFWIKTFHTHDTHYLAYQGHLCHLNKLIRGKKISNLSYKRKNIMLLNGTDPVNFDLNLLDNYKRSIQNKSDVFGNQRECMPVKDLNTILKLFGCESSAVQIINLRPFKKEIVPVDNVCIDMLYE